MHRNNHAYALFFASTLAACSSDKGPGSISLIPDASTPAAEGGVSIGSSDAAGIDSGTHDAGGVKMCADLPGKIVYIESGDTQENLLKNLGRQLREQGITIAFNLTGSCTLTNDIYTVANVVPNGTLKYIPSAAENAAWKTSDPEPTCQTGASGVPIDLAISALFVESCGLGGPPVDSGLTLIQGPVQAYTFVVPEASDQTAIWAEEAYYAFGFGNANPLAPKYNPWNDEMFMFIRPTTKSTLVATAKNIDVPPAQWKGVQEAASSDVVSAVVNSTNAEASIGILGAEVYDANRGKGLKTLAFQAFGQGAAYFPDSSASAFDKQNVRDGHYSLWSPTVYITKTDANGPVNPSVAAITDAVLGKAATLDGLADAVKVGLIPECAMQVSRTTDGGDLTPFTPPASCTCYYLSKIAGATGSPAGCTPCDGDAGCGDGGTCQFGFCESGAPAVAPSDAGCVSGTPKTSADLLNACTTATAVTKKVVLPSAKLEPLP
ncbi:MAG TPA: hypothetical protein VH062_31370 [Polyangiaceae bacterium]|jgi:hypothetical protein|nr:hypothetical protein [Polyangiaceae bacterium]